MVAIRSGLKRSEKSENQVAEPWQGLNSWELKTVTYEASQVNLYLFILNCLIFHSRVEPLVRR
jgi:hypothetical protein